MNKYLVELTPPSGDLVFAAIMDEDLSFKDLEQKVSATGISLKGCNVRFRPIKNQNMDNH